VTQIDREKTASGEAGTKQAFGSVPAHLALARNKHENGLRSATTGGKGVQKGKNAGIGEGDP